MSVPFIISAEKSDSIRGIRFRTADGYCPRDGLVADTAAASSYDDAFYVAIAGYDRSGPHAGSDFPLRARFSQQLYERYYSRQQRIGPG
jgi:hypothetical protein